MEQQLERIKFFAGFLFPAAVNENDRLFRSFPAAAWNDPFALLFDARNETQRRKV